MNIEQLSFDFNKPLHTKPEVRHRASWQIKAIAHRHNLPLAQAAIIAGALRYPMGGIR